MKKIIITFFLFVTFFSFSSAQDFKFNLKKNGTFELDKEGTSFVVIPFEGKTAQELYRMVKFNILNIYKNPKLVLNEIEPVSLTIHALSDEMYSSYNIPRGIVTYYAYYNLNFHFKDGRIKVDSPTIDSDLLVEASNYPLPKSFPSFVSGLFDKNGSPKEKKKDTINKIESYFNTTIYSILGYYNKSDNIKDNW
ncbi:MAG: hypothetical protein KBS94_05295 [Prevotella sp.]|nr:hypothetical protein [Candidatus Equicola faecalis]